MSTFLSFPVGEGLGWGSTGEAPRNKKKSGVADWIQAFPAINEQKTPKPIQSVQHLLDITAEMEDPATCQTQQYRFKHTYHSFERASQRGIGKEQLALALAYGKTYHKQGLIFYVLGEKSLPAHLRPKSNARNIVAVVDGDSGVVLTCYRNPAPHKYIRLKPKRFVRFV